MTTNELLDFIFDTENGLVDSKKGHHGVVVEFNTDAIALIETLLELPSGSIEFTLEKGIKLGLVVKKPKLDKNGKTYNVFFKIDPKYHKDNSEQLRKITAAITRFKDKPIE